MKRITYIPADSKKPDLATADHKDLKAPSLDEMQKYVEGYIELISVSVNGKRAYLFVNEEGLRLKLPFNGRASVIAGRHIVGNAILLEGFKDSEL